MLEREQKQVLAAFLLEALTVPVTGRVVADWVGPTVVWNLESYDRIHKVAEWIIDQVLRLPQQVKFVAMVRALSQSGDAALAPFVTIADDLEQGRLQWVPQVAAPSFDWTLDADPLAIRDGRPFVDRGGFRALLPRRDATADSPACILVTGDAGGGKSYLHDFCEAFATARRGFRVGHAKLGGSSAAQLEARTVARELSLGLGVPQSAIPPRHEDSHRDADNLAAWIAGYTPAGPVPAVAILDEFGRVDLSESVHRFIVQLSLRLQRDDRAREKLRLVLMGYDEGRLKTEGIHYHTYVLEEVEEADIVAWFRRKYPNHEDYRYESAAQMIHASVSQCPAGQRMLVLNQEVRAVGLEFG